MDLQELLRRALEKEAEASKTCKGLEPDEALEIAEALAKIEKIDLDKLAEEKLEAMTPIDQVVERLKQGKQTGLALKKAKKQRPKVNWRKKKARRRVYDKKRYVEVLKPQRAARLAEELQTPEGWWVYLNRTWKQMGVEVRMTEEEFREVLYPAFYPNVPVFFRYDKRGSIRLDNLLVRDSNTRVVLFDGKEWRMRKGGWML